MEAVVILGFKDRSSVTRMVAEHRLVPSRKMPGATGAYLFWRADVQRLADDRPVKADEITNPEPVNGAVA